MTLCKFCNSSLTYEYQKLISPINSLVYTLYKCNSCKSYFFKADEHDLDLKTMYDGFVSRDDFPLAFTPSKKWAKEKNRIVKYLKRPVKSVLDVGCRTGDFLMHFPEHCNRTGVELSAAFSSIARERSLTVYNDFLENIEFSDSFDVVSCYAILEHLENPLFFIDNLSSLVNKKGVLVIMIPSIQSLKPRILQRLKMPWHMFSPPEHLNFYSREFLDNYLEEKGFKKVSRRYTSGGMLLSGKKAFSAIEKYLTAIVDNTFLSKFAFFDHMYSYYVKK